MSPMSKIWLLTMLEREIAETEGTISNETLWSEAGATEEDSQMHEGNIADLEEYKELLIEIKERVEKEVLI